MVTRPVVPSTLAAMLPLVMPEPLRESSALPLPAIGQPLLSEPGWIRAPGSSWMGPPPTATLTRRAFGPHASILTVSLAGVRSTSALAPLSALAAPSAATASAASTISSVWRPALGAGLTRLSVWGWPMAGGARPPNFACRVS